MDEYTLISSLGTGMYKKEGGYRKTLYVFPNGDTCETAYFLDAILQTKYKKIRKLILIGTRTSSWDILIDQNDCDLWLLVKEQCENDGITDENVQIIQKNLSEKIEIPVVLKVHTPKIDLDTTEEIFSVYNSLSSELIPNTKILFDITHGFRSMPILIYQSLQFSTVNQQLPSVDLIYGEYIDQEKKSYVRDLSKYWKLSEITYAINQFKVKLDGTILCEKIKPYWDRGSKVVKRITDIVNLNYSLQIVDILKQLKNALADRIDNQPDWIESVRTYLDQIYARLNCKTQSETLFKYALFLKEKHLNTQAIIALQVSVETAITEKYGSAEYIGDYDWWQKNGKSEYDRIKRNHRELKEPLREIENLRNGIAHAGARNKFSKVFPSSSNIPEILKTGIPAVQSLFIILEEEK